jgi:hypothetical protein
VGDQAGGITEARNTSPEKDDDWIKISQHVKLLNPSILKDATSALKREKWRGEGVQQAVFEQPCVNAVSSVNIACTSKTLVDRVQQLLAALTGDEGPSRNDTFMCAGLQLKVQLMGADWVRWRSLRGKPELAKFEGLEFVCESNTFQAMQKVCAERDIAFAQKQDDNTCSLNLHPTPTRSTAGRLMQQVAMALTSDIDVVPPLFTLRLAHTAGTEPAATAPASRGDTEAQQVRVKEIVIGAAWDEHTSYEVLFDRLAGAEGRVSLGLWRLPCGVFVRLVPSDDSGVKALVFRVRNAEAAQGVLSKVGFPSRSFPGYLAVGIAGLDVRLSEKEEEEPFFAEVRWEVEVEGEWKTAGTDVSCIGAISHGALHSARSGVMTKNLTGLSKLLW